MTDLHRTRARRAAARALHPDVGGDADQFMAALAAIDHPVLVRRSRRTRLLVALRRTRGRLPVGRRYISL